MQDHRIRDIDLASEGRKSIEWAESRMPLLMALRKKYSRSRPLRGHTIGGCLHVTKETAVLIRTIRACGGEPVWSGCNPLTTQDSVAAALVEDGISVFAWNGLSPKEYYWCIEQVISRSPDLTLDDGADLIFTLHSKHERTAESVIGGTEETTTGVLRLRAMAEDGALLYPVVAVNDAETKWDFDNVYGTGQSVLDGVLRATSILIAGKCVVVAGYGHCGRGIAMRSRGLGARVVVVEVDPLRALKAAMEGFEVRRMNDAAPEGDLFITATGMKGVIRRRHIDMMRDGAILCNAGHYDVEINLRELASMSVSKKDVRPHTEEFRMKDGRRIYLLARGRLVNLVAAEGHPSEVMDMSFANQFLSLLHLARNGRDMERRVHPVPAEQDALIARLKLASMGMGVDDLTPAQKRYITEYSAGT